jgi:hypothetical protein
MSLLSHLETCQGITEPPKLKKVVVAINSCNLNTNPSPSPSTNNQPNPVKKRKVEKKDKDSIKKVKVPVPLNLDTHCGVKLDNGQLCTRSITCKIHSISLKRIVIGRSQSYDVLYQDYVSKAKKSMLDSSRPAASTAYRN